VVYDDAAASTLAFVRYADGARPVLVASNFTPAVWTAYRFGVPEEGTWEAILNSDAADYGGSGLVSVTAADTEAVPAHGFESSIVIDVPALATVVLAPKKKGA
jgi:1,4-alpha-glucan branching enzyme